MKKNNLFIAIPLSAVILGGVMLAGCSQTAPETPTTAIDKIEDREKISMTIDDREFTVEAVTSIDSITKGLGERDTIGSDGMLFVLPSRQVATFWMKGMRFGLDFVWIDGNKVVKLTEAAPAPEDPYSPDMPRYSSEVPVTHVLELSVGSIKQNKIEVGDTVSIAASQE